MSCFLNVHIRYIYIFFFLQAWLGLPDVADKVYEAIVVYYLPVQGNIEVSVHINLHFSFALLLGIGV